MFGDENNQVMPATLCSAWVGIDWEKYHESSAKPGKILFKAFEDGIFRNNDPHHTGITPTGQHLGGGNMGHLFGLNPLDEKSLTEGLIEGRLQAVEFKRYYKEYIPGYENIELTATASLPGIRESRRITGDYIMNLEDYKASQTFDDEIGRYCYPIDILPSSTDQKAQDEFEALIKSLHYKPGESYGIPYRILTVKGFDNLLTAGRSVMQIVICRDQFGLCLDVLLLVRLLVLLLQLRLKMMVIFVILMLQNFSKS
jgi:FAD dependent oxidoreductase